MLLRLVPEQPHPTILFTLAFNNLPEGLPFPPAWTSQLQHILHDELEMPQCIHALDKAAWAACLLHEVTFSVPGRRVSAMFIDGTSAEWPLEDEKLGKALKVVMDDVSESSVAAEMEQRRAQAIQAAAQAQAAQERMPDGPTVSMQPKGKHKKSRSLLMSLVASFCPSAAPAPLPLAPPRPIAPAELAPPPPEPPVSSRHLRRKARAGLVDIYRQYILPALAAGPVYSINRTGLEGGSGGGYVLWNLQSILRRIEARMHELGVQLGSTTPSRSSSIRSYGFKLRGQRYRVAGSAFPEPPYDEEDESSSGTGEGSTESTDTDASSVCVQTPQDVLPEYPLLCAGSAQDADNARIQKEGGIINPVARFGSPLPSALSGQQYPSPQVRVKSHRPKKRYSQPPSATQHHAQQHEYAILHASTIRLRVLINRTSEFVHAQTEERSVALVQLEKRSRRRAWSCKQLTGGAWMDVGMREGLAVPLKSTGLRWSWTVSSIAEAESSSEKMQLHGRLQGLGRPSGPPSRRPNPNLVEQDELPPPTVYVPSQASCVPFPQTETEGDDFCSTGPQDTSTLFGAGEGEDDESTEVVSTQQQEQLAPFARSTSSDDLPSLFSSLSTPTSSSVVSTPSTSPSPSEFSCNSEPSAFEAELEDLELGRPSPPYTLDSPAFGGGELPGEEFRATKVAGPLGFENPSVSAPIPVPQMFTGEATEMMMPMERGMGARLFARRQAALLR